MFVAVGGCSPGGNLVLSSGSGNEPRKRRTTSPGLWRGRNGSDASCPETDRDADLLWKHLLSSKRASFLKLSLRHLPFKLRPRN